LSLKDEWLPLRPEFMGAPFWFWNDDLDPVELRRQIGRMHEKNVGGFFMHARMGRVTPYMSPRWMECVRACVDEAARLGMHAWIYDEDGWPSGYGGGLVNALGEEYLQKYATPRVIEITGPVVALPAGVEHLAVFLAKRGIAPGTPAVDGTQTDRTAPSQAAGTSPFCEPRRVPGSAIREGRVWTAGFEGDVVVCFVKEINNFRRHFAPECWTDGYVDVLDRKVVRAFLRKIYEAYRREVGPQFGKAVPGVFTDEPNYHDHKWFGDEVRLPWSPVLEREFARRYGGPLADSLFDIAYGTGDAFRARWCFYSALAHLFADNYTKTLAEWCGRHNLVFTGHFLLEESPRAATQTIGDPMRHYEYQQAPGIDHLGRNIDLTEFWTSARILVKQAASVAHQLGKERVLCETFAGGGWDFGPLEQKWMGDWQYALGVNLLCQHAFHYSLRGFRKRDYPPSLSFQQPWWELSAPLGAHFARLGYALTRGMRVVNVLVLHPIESFFATHATDAYPWPGDHVNDALKRLVEELLSNQIDFDFGNEELLRKHGRIDGRALCVGAGRYEVVIVPHALTWRAGTLRLVRRFVRAGGALFFVEPRADHVDARPSDRPDVLPARGTSLGQWDDAAFPSRIAALVGPAARSAVRLNDPAGASREVVMMHRRADDEDIFFLASAAKASFEVEATFRAAGVPCLYDTATGATVAMSHRRNGDECTLRLEFDYGRSFLIVFSGEAPLRRAEQAARRSGPRESVDAAEGERSTAASVAAASAEGEPQPGVTRTLCNVDESVEYELDGPNALILDRAVLVVDGRESEPILLLEARERMSAMPVGTRGLLRFAFESERPIASASLLVETPERFTLAVNGKCVRGGQAGWLVDPCFRRLAVPDGLRKGRNVVEAAFEWQPDLELEPLYVLGRFGVYEENGECRIAELPPTLTVGPWERQGLAFYAGTVTYRLQCELDSATRRWQLCCEGMRIAANVRVNGCDAGCMLWPPYALDITPHVRGGMNRIDIAVANSLRNFLGPHHMDGEDEIQCLGPHNFFEKHRWVNEYRLKPAGLLGRVFLRGY